MLCFLELIVDLSSKTKLHAFTIMQEKMNSDVNYQCRCSFLEVCLFQTHMNDSFFFEDFCQVRLLCLFSADIQWTNQ